VFVSRLSVQEVGKAAGRHPTLDGFSLVLIRDVHVHHPLGVEFFAAVDARFKMGYVGVDFRHVRTSLLHFGESFATVLALVERFIFGVRLFFVSEQCLLVCELFKTGRALDIFWSHRCKIFVQSHFEI